MRCHRYFKDLFSTHPNIFCFQDRRRHPTSFLLRAHARDNLLKYSFHVFGYKLSAFLNRVLCCFILKWAHTESTILAHRRVAIDLVFPKLINGISFPGIFAYLNYLEPKSRKEILECLVRGLKRLEYRGYDSAGLAFCGGYIDSQVGLACSLTKYYRQAREDDLPALAMFTVIISSRGFHSKCTITRIGHILISCSYLGKSGPQSWKSGSSRRGCFP